MIGLDRSGPDEFAVESRAPLTIPPEFNLRPPQPGATRPQEVTAEAKAKNVIDAAGPGKPGEQASSLLKAPTVAGGSGREPVASNEVAPNSLASKLLGSNDTAAGGTVAKRDTETLKGVY